MIRAQQLKANIKLVAEIAVPLISICVAVYLAFRNCKGRNRADPQSPNAGPEAILGMAQVVDNESAPVNQEWTPCFQQPFFFFFFCIWFLNALSFVFQSLFRWMKFLFSKKEKENANISFSLLFLQVNSMGLFCNASAD